MSVTTITILLIEDDNDDALVSTKILKKSETDALRFDILQAERLKDGLALLQSKQIQLILLDLSLPDSRGLDTFFKVREAAPNIPVVICSGLEDEKVAIQAISQGAQDYVVKGQISQRGFEKIVRYALERQKIQEMKEEFVGMVIHDLRSPLVVAHEALGQIAEGVLGPLTKDQNTFLRMAINAMQRLERMVGDLLEVTKGDLGKLHLEKETVDLKEAVHEMVEGFRMVAEKKNIPIVEHYPETPLRVSIDKGRIGQVVMNFMSNALKFTSQGQIEVELKDEPDQIVCSVADTGCGIPPEAVPKIFDKFEQFHQTRTQRGSAERGTGLGLAIAKGIVLAHHGKIWAESKVGCGTRIFFSLPKTTE